MGYKHLTREQRYTIEALLQTPMSLRENGEVIGVSTGTVSREIRRNCDMRGYHRYRWHLAQKKYERRMKARRHYLKFTDEMKRTVRRFIIYGQYRTRGIIQDRVDISQRPAVVDEKRRFGDFQIDTIIGKNHKGAIMTTNDRCTHLLLIRRLAEIEWKLNHRPRKSLGYRTPLEYCKQLFNFYF